MAEYEAADLSYPATSLVSGTVIYDKEAPAPPAFQGKWKATYSDSHTSSAECDSSSAITAGEIDSTKLQSVEIGDCVTSIGNTTFFNCSTLTSVTISNSVTSIGNGAFRECGNLSSIIIPDSVTSIGIAAFSNCRSLTNITIPSGVTSIELQTFYFCTSLESVTVLATTPPYLGTEAFSFTNDCPIYVPNESVNAYKSAWSEYASRIHAIDGPAGDDVGE